MFKRQMSFLKGKKFSKFRKSRNNNCKTLYKYYCRYSIISCCNSFLNSSQIEAARKVLVRNIRNNGRIVVRVFPDVPITKKPIEVRMGSGKGDLFGYIYRVKKGSVIIDYDFSDYNLSLKIHKLTSMKFPFRTLLVKNY
ncbi:50S ribosomal protein L16 [Candidatus Vidania fulgoroideorum]